MDGMAHATAKAGSAAIVLLAIVVGIHPAAALPEELTLAARRADFREFVADFTDNYAWLERAEKPWLSWPGRYAADVAAARTPESFAAVLEAALDELHDFHAEVRSRNPHRWLPVPTFADIWAEADGLEARVIAVRRGSDAERAGVAPGDHITQVGGEALADAIDARLTAAVNGQDEGARGWALLSLLAGRADEERHFTLRDAQGRSRTIGLPLERRFDRAAGALIVQHLPGQVGLVRLNNSLGEQQTVSAFDQALAQLKGTAGLILDLRDVPSGGDSSVALGLMGRLVRTMQAYQRHRIPNYGQGDVERNWLELVAPRGPFTYEAPMVVLVDHWTGSMGEGMAVGLDAMQRAVVVGTPMAHLAGAVSDFRLHQTGIDVAFATEQLYHPNGTLRQNWLPPILVAEPATGSADAVLARGLAALGKLIASRGPSR